MTTYVYVSNADDGCISIYEMRADGSLEPRGRAAAEKTVGPLAVSPDRRWLIAATRSHPCWAHSYSIENGALRNIGKAPLPESFPYITLDRTGRFLLGASYGGDMVSVNAVAPDGRVGEALQVMPTARKAHAIITDRSNRYVFVPHLGTDQVLQFLFDEKSGRLTANTPPLVQLAAGHGPRHIRTSPDNRFVYLLNELTAVVTTFALEDGRLRETGSASALAPDSRLVPGSPRPHQNDVSNHIWAADLHVTPDGRLLFASERTTSTINALRVDGGKLTYLGSTATEKQPRAFALDGAGRFMVVTGEKSDTISSYAIEASGALRLIGRYPTAKGALWAEIVTL
ncbi:MAG TPA: beta-propeller fold lactonase family protein [Burkholderiales bacterium]|nr:beta-propeller fold lactonase family protein [Burkholderiales bacterium]